MSWKGAVASASVSVLLLLLALAGPLAASPEADTTFRFQIDETVFVFLRGCTEQSIDLDIEGLGLRQYVYFPCPLEVVTGAITDYELRLAAEAVVRKGISRERINVNPLEIRLDQDRMTGLACLPSSDRVEVNDKVIKFIPAVELPDSLLLFTGCNNTANPTTTAPIEARVDLTELPGDVLSTGAQVVFTLEFIIIER